MSTDYIKNKDFEAAIVKLHQAKQDDDKEEIRRLEVQLIEYFYLLADNILKGFRFTLINRDDALQEGVMSCFEKLDRFNPSRGKAFNYYTTCTLNHYKQLYRMEKNYNEFKKKLYDHLIDENNEVASAPGHNNQTKAVFRQTSEEL